MRHLALIAAVVTGFSAASTPTDFPFVRIRPDQIHWVDVAGSHGVQTATLQGDPTKPGFYVVRVKFPPYVMDRPHWHPNDRYITVLQGTWYAGTGPVFDPKRAGAMPTGSFMVHPGHAAHWDGSASADTVIVQISGNGPATTTPLYPQQPFWVEVPH